MPRSSELTTQPSCSPVSRRPTPLDRSGASQQTTFVPTCEMTPPSSSAAPQASPTPRPNAHSTPVFTATPSASNDSDRPGSAHKTAARMSCPPTDQSCKSHPDRVGMIVVASNDRTAWRATLEATNAVLRVFEAEMEQRVGISLAWYDVLLHLWEAPGHSLRMNELANSLVLSRSWLTRRGGGVGKAGHGRHLEAEEAARAVCAVLSPQ